LGDKFYIFNVYSLVPYQNSEKHNAVFIKEMMDSQYSDEAYDGLIASLMKSSNYQGNSRFCKSEKILSGFSKF
jgi:peptidyl-prolyl cis-trans isomerase SurA